MRRSPATMINALFGDTGPVVLAACLLVWPAIATAGVDTLCDEQARDTVTLDIEVDDLALELADLPGNNLLTPIDLDASVDPDEYQRSSAIDQLRLQQLFEQANLARLSGTFAPRQSLNPPLVDLSERTTSDSNVELAEDASEAVTDDARQSPPAVNTRVPGISQDDLLRYRQKMYRTDI